MPYLTIEEYNEFGFTEMEQTEFNKLLKRASDVLDSITRSFYQFNDLSDDVPFRRDKFKKAVAAQIEYFYDMGGTSAHELNSPQTVIIGRTQIATGDANQRKLNKSIVSDDVYMYLRETGLLYRGLGVIG